MLFTMSESPVVVVLSGSMEPAFQRGDILFLHLGRKPVRTGEIVVFNLNTRDVPIVHRVVRVHERGPAKPDAIDILTKVWHQPLLQHWLRDWCWTLYTHVCDLV